MEIQGLHGKIILLFFKLKCKGSLLHNIRIAIFDITNNDNQTHHVYYFISLFKIFSYNISFMVMCFVLAQNKGY